MINTQAVDVTSELQRFGILTSVRLSIWSGTFTPKANEVPGQNTEAIAKKIARQGQIILVDQEQLAPFTQLRGRVNAHLTRVGYAFPILRGAFFTMLQDVPEIARFLREDIDPEFNAILDSFLARYDTLKAERCALFNETFPGITGYLDDKFPTPEDLRKRFKVNHCMVNWSSPAIGQVAEEEVENFQQQTRSFMAELALDIRQAAVDACLSFKKALSTKSGKVNDNAIAKFKSMLDRIQSHNFLGDSKLDDLVVRIRSSVFDSDKWTSEESLKELIKQSLDEVVQLGSEEGEAAAVCENFVRRISGEEAAEVVEGEGDSITSMNRNIDPAPFTEESEEEDEEDDGEIGLPTLSRQPVSDPEQDQTPEPEQAGLEATQQSN